MIEDHPRSLQAERALLSAIMLDPRHYKRIGTRLTPHLFTHPLHGELAQVMRDVHGAGLDVAMVTVLDYIDRDDARIKKFRSNDGMALLAELTSAGVPSNAADSYLKLAEERAAKRDILKASEELAMMARSGATAPDLAQMLHVYARKMTSVLTAAEEIRTVDVEGALTNQLPPIPWLAEGWVGQGDLVIFGGEWASGKSLVAVDLAISVATGLPWMGRIPIAMTGPTLYVDEENNARNVVRRLGRMLRGRAIEPGTDIPVRYLSKNHLRLDTLRGLETLERELIAHRPILCVLDSLIRFHGADENSNTDIAAVFSEITRLATKYGCAFIVLDHMRKPGKGDEDHDQGHRIRGAGDKAGVGDGVWTIEGDRETDARTLSCRKNRWEDSLPPAMTTKWKVSEDETAAWIECSDAVLTAEVACQTVLSTQPSGLLASDLYERMERLGTNKRTAQRTVKALVSRGQVESRKERGRCVRYWVGTLVEDKE